MLPSVLDRSDTPSPGERIIYDFLKYAPGTEDWVAFHSQRLARLEEKPQGEADFVICAPDFGILVLEVKAHQRIERRDGRWFYGFDAKPGKDPFKQASDAMYSLMKSLGARVPEISKRVMFSSAVAFTHVSSLPETDEWRHDQVIDATSMLPASFAAAVRASLRTAAANLQETAGIRFSQSEHPTAAPSPLSLEHLGAIEKVLRPSFEAILSPAQRGARHNDELLRLTEEQYRALDDMEHNDRVVFEGPAGTGKTLLAIEATRRAHDKGERVLLVCHNRGLGGYLHDALADRADNCLFAGTLHSYLMRLTGLETPDQAYRVKDFFETTLPDAALDLLLQGGPNGFEVDTHGFDTIVVDELQDLLTEEYLEIISSLLRHSSEGTGKIFMFGDIENQAFFDGRNPASLRKLIKGAVGAVSFRNLTVNCRNAPEVVNLVESLFEVRPAYSHVPPRADRYPPEYKRYANHPEQELVKVLNRLHNSGYLPLGVAILSLGSEATSLAERLNDAKWRPRLKPLGMTATEKDVTATSIYRFKGLESPIVILTDIDQDAFDAKSEGLYVGLTRSTLMTILLVENAVADALIERVMSLHQKRTKE